MPKKTLLLLLPITTLILYVFYICLTLNQTSQNITIIELDSNNQNTTTSTKSTKTEEKPNEIACLTIKTNETLPDISNFPPNKNKRNIFFMETSCKSHDKGKLFLKARQACAVESAANMNPATDVYLLITSPGVFKDENTESDRIIKALQKYSNIKLMYYNVERFVQGSPVEPLWKSGRVKASNYPLAHISDVLRLLVLWKYGGIYLDLDIVVIKNLDTLPTNFAGAETSDVLASGVMGYDAEGTGHQFLTKCLNDLNEHFDGVLWAANGPLLITRNIMARCPDKQAKDVISSGHCEDFYIMSTPSFYPIHWSEWYKYFDPNLLTTIENEIDAKSYLIHVWNKLSVDKLIPKNQTEVPYLHVAKRYCPEVVKQLDEYF
ncbi:lactosylceramide 4-alpha-galactosyltransferase-like isoform X2 [Anthonomus grandis grandis]|nr:lactosylceramide 4-alpha-galactosyltransferase-like isoform X2 [Anthonomus grandis grandis]XP_050297521.1 lactosylceramide 4-alpha-galactosyltransferase-like isoform X2 [Anthonomus grandis grandis]XP_050297523.1 lactosylceramide 4-alpha-galactosyltransferase-like isoform X2 [Anthonomus grandis grandis]XP_050297524.1 lactosylceramide 4-alpha-galactosyltransferase-like isoform X2 [Anthonomus grandis grandis]